MTGSIGETTLRIHQQNSKSTFRSETSLFANLVLLAIRAAQWRTCHPILAFSSYYFGFISSELKTPGRQPSGSDCVHDRLDRRDDSTNSSTEFQKYFSFGDLVVCKFSSISNPGCTREDLSSYTCFFVVLFWIH